MNNVGDSHGINRYKTYVLFLSTYTFLSGFVFIEPSPAEIWFTLTVPFLLLGFKVRWSVIFATISLFLPLFLSSFIGLALYGVFNPRFFIIDIYLFSFFFVLSSYASSLKKYAEKILDKLMISWSWAGAINILAGIFCYLTGRRTLLNANVVRFGIRLTGFFKDPNVLGPFLIPVSVYFLMQFLKDRGNKFANLTLFSFFSFGVLLSFSRAAWLDYAVSMFFLIIMRLQKRKMFLKILGITAILIIAFSVFWFLADKINFFGITLKDFFLSRLGLQSYDIGRFEAQHQFIEILSSTSALFGIGPGNYEIYSAGFATHSLYARYIGERGLFGFSLFVVFWIFVLKKTIASRNKDFLLPVLFGQLANSFFIDSLHWRHLWLIIALVFLG